MHEDFVTFEQAQQLKELGFDWWGSTIYVDGHLTPTFILSYAYIERDNCLPAPTIYLVQKWFREVHGIDIDIDSVYHMLDTGNKIMYGLRIGIQKTFQKEFYLNYDSHKEALSTGIDHAIKIIKQQNK